MNAVNVNEPEVNPKNWKDLRFAKNYLLIQNPFGRIMEKVVDILIWRMLTEYIGISGFFLNIRIFGIFWKKFLNLVISGALE
jgi:hypothetical protein